MGLATLLGLDRTMIKVVTVVNNDTRVTESVVIASGVEAGPSRATSVEGTTAIRHWTEDHIEVRHHRVMAGGKFL